MSNRKQTSRINNYPLLQHMERLPFLYLVFVLIGLFLTHQADAAEQNIAAVGQVNFINPETGIARSCSGTLIAPSRVATVASCILSEETSKQARSAQVCFRANGQRDCYNSRQILSNSNYLATNGVDDSSNLAYIELDSVVSGITPVKELSPSHFEQLLSSDIASLSTIWVGYDSRGISSRTPIKKSYLTLSGLEYDYLNRRITLETAEILPGQHYEGTAVIIEREQQYFLLGMISSSYPDDIVHYYPEVNPCDEDPVIVRYPEPVMRSLTKITAYPIAACGMTGFQSVAGYNELQCVRMARRSSLDKALDEANPIAMRQQALAYIASDDTTDHVIDIYQLLDKAIKAGDTKAHTIMADLLLEGEVFPRDSDTANAILSQQTSAEAHWLQARELLKGYSEQDMRSINETLDQSLYSHLLKASEAGLASAQYFLARLYQFGIGVKEDARTAYQWYARAAMQGEARAQFQLGTMWVDGRGVRSYPQVGHYWIRQAAARGYIKAQNYLALNRQQSIDDALDEYEFEYSDTE